MTGRSMAFIFPGQGSQKPGMGMEFAQGNTWADRMWEEANDILGYDLRAKISGGTQEELNQTLITQPAVYMTEMITFQALSNAGISPGITAGHSLGEYAAVAASGALSWQKGLELVKFRAETFEEVASRKPGGMLAVIGMDEGALAGIVGQAGGVCEIVNYNSPGQMVVSLEKDLVGTMAAKIKEAGAKLVVPLKVSGGFHSSLMDDAVGPMKDKIDGMSFNQPSADIYVNWTGEKTGTADLIKEALVRQVNSAVRWITAINNISAASCGDITFLEVGPGNVLQGLLKRIDRKLDVRGIALPADIDKLIQEG
ncbi:MAG: ACP S-malonyltransferase [Elusimicrobia bacterium]|nr:ACP S-malonyltransferase [Elusimicrobiota bacterium]